MEFKKITLSESEKTWLKATLEKDFQKIDANWLKVELHKELSPDFDPENIDWRIYRNERLSLVGLWHIDKSSEYFNLTISVINYIRELILQKTQEKEFIVESVAKGIKEQVDKVGVAFLLASDLGFFNGGTWMDDKIAFKSVTLSRQKPFDKFLSFESLEASIENFFISNKPRDVYVDFQPKNNKAKLVESFTDDTSQIWQLIHKEYGISKVSFGKKIKFVKEKYKRKAIFRDVAHAYILAKYNFPKPSIILSGGVVEELLRLYLKSLKINPEKESFFSYIEACKKKKSLINPLNNLSDSVRHFRNFIHLEKETDSKDELTNFHAINAISSIFSISNGFSI